ncbi:MAG: hypothetical protein J3K34DRAFT_475968 [Monoraphidium minutum]|nr:MAG: hypothetical protein J3K34DRAFT_475968 [Monoraphidium minutum]
MVCFIIRTYWGHGTYGDNSLSNLLWSLAKQQHQRWEALLVVMDNRPFPDLRHVLRYNNDSRAAVFAEWISASNAPKADDNKSWRPGYHSRLYGLTDRAIRACPRDTEWLVVTNGDNDYDPGFLARVFKEAAAEGADAVAFDYYSRFQRPTGNPCERFAARKGAPRCKPNLMRWCQTDLAATAYRWRKFVGRDGGGEEMLFAGMDQGISHDGQLAQRAVSRGWKVAHVRDACLVDHAPTPQQCALHGRVWDDRDAGSDHGMGGKCLPPLRAAEARAQAGVEEVEVKVAHDTSFGLPKGPLKLTCLRWADRGRWDALRRYFGEGCAEPPPDQIPGFATARPNKATAAA